MHFIRPRCLLKGENFKGKLKTVLIISEEGDNELLTLEIIHNYVELLDQYFGSVCELDIIYNYEKVKVLKYNICRCAITFLGLFYP